MDIFLGQLLRDESQDRSHRTYWDELKDRVNFTVIEWWGSPSLSNNTYVPVVVTPWRLTEEARESQELDPTLESTTNMLGNQNDEDSLTSIIYGSKKMCS